MAHNKKTNLRRVPQTMADVRRAYGEGYQDGMKDLMDIMVYTIGTDMEMSDEWLERFHERFMKNLDCHINGELTTYDIRSTMYAEKGWEVKIL